MFFFPSIPHSVKFLWTHDILILKFAPFLGKKTWKKQTNIVINVSDSRTFTRFGLSYIISEAFGFLACLPFLRTIMDFALINELTISFTGMPTYPEICESKSCSAYW